ncbi:hypothetical protein V3N99_07420 [Dermatophilaceae bacterium Soc4.6]
MTHRAKNVVESAAERPAAPALRRGATALTYAASDDLAGCSAHRGTEHDLTGSLREKLEVTPGARRSTGRPETRRKIRGPLGALAAAGLEHPQDGDRDRRGRGLVALPTRWRTW